MSPTDLTRWNRAGLPRFRYVDANAATLLEALRLELAERFNQWQALQLDVPPDETVAERTARMLAQYHADRRDWAWEITRSFARAVHILTEHVDAFANEGYLRTATQWQSVRRLAAMVGYAPAPASSATTPLVLIAKDEVTSAKVQRGFSVKHIPADAPPVIFETLEDIEIAPELNELRLVGWNRNANLLTDALLFPLLATVKPLLWSIPEKVKVSVGGLAILAKEGSGAVFGIGSVADAKLTLSGPPPIPPATTAPAPAVPLGLTFDTALLHVSPSQILVPFLNGTDVVRVVAPHDLVAGDVVAWKLDGATPLIRFAKVLEAGAGALRLKPTIGVALPTRGMTLFRAATITSAQFAASGSEWRLPTVDRMPRSGDFRVTFVDSNGELDAGFPLTTSNAPEAKFPPPPPATDPNAGKTQGFHVLNVDQISTTQLWFADPGKDKPAALVRDDILPAKTTTLEFDGKPPALLSGDPVVLQTASEYVARRINRIEKDAGSYRLVFTPGFDTASVKAVHASFAATLRPPGYDRDPAPLIADNKLELEHSPAAKWPALLHRGRQLVLESENGSFASFAVRIASQDPVHWTIRIDRSVATRTQRPMSRGDLIIRANVVNAGHGETKPVRVLGNGDASANNQRFAIDVDDVSQVRDASMPGGIRADIRVEAEREIYSQVATLRDSEPADPHYVVRITEIGTLELEFGDGRHGRRLPSGSNNVFATIRRGSGLSGNLPAAALTDIVKKHPAIASFLHPIAATGGDEREALDQIRESAPGRLGAMDRAISVSDYQRLAQRFQGVWHAMAFEQPTFRRSREAVRIVIVPAGGGELGALDGEIRSYLLANGLPSIDVMIELFVSVPVEIAVKARVDSTRFDPRDVEGRVRAAVLAAFDLRRRRPGQPIYRSEVTRVVENTDGVSNSDVSLFATTAAAHESEWGHAARGHDGGIWAVFPKDNQVIYAKSAELISVSTAEATI